MEIFKNNDQGYILWLNQNPNGVVINANNPPNANYLVAHRASCYTINASKPSPGKDWTNKYIKVCGESLSEVTDWTIDEFGVKPYCCRHCSPV